MPNNNYPVVFGEVSRVLRSEDMQRQVNSMLPPSVKADKFTEVTLAAIQNNPDVLEADRDSLYRACVSAARRGLLPDKQEGALVIFNTNVGSRDRPSWMKLVQFMPMVGGIIKEMAKAGINAYAVSVYANDKISLWNDDEGQHVQHEPVVFGDRGEIVGVFAAAKTSDGRTYVEAMSLADVRRVMARSKQCSTDQRGQIVAGGTWKSDFDRMGQKSALHRLRKRLPIVDEDALQNLKDMEEESDIVLGDTAGSTATPQAANTPSADPVQSAPPPPAEQGALPSPEQVNQQDEVLKSKPRTRRSRVLEGVVQAAKASGQNGGGAGVSGKEAVSSGQQAAFSGRTPGAAPAEQTKTREQEWTQEPYNEDDIV